MYVCLFEDISLINERFITEFYVKARLAYTNENRSEKQEYSCRWKYHETFEKDVFNRVLFEFSFKYTDRVPEFLD